MKVERLIEIKPCSILECSNFKTDIEKQKSLLNTSLDSVVDLADDPHGLVRKCLLDDLVAGLGALLDAVPHEERVGHLGINSIALLRVPFSKLLGKNS